MLGDPIPNESLTTEDIPADDAGWDEVQAFALTFDGYSELGSFEAVAELANRRQPATLTEYRACLFFEQRRWRHFAQMPDEKALEYIRDLVAGIRACVSGDISR